MKNGKFEGKGTLKWKDGSYYHGIIINIFQENFKIIKDMVLVNFIKKYRIIQLTQQKRQDNGKMMYLKNDL